MRMMVATWWMICSLKSCAQERGREDGYTDPAPTPSSLTCLLTPRPPPRSSQAAGLVSHVHYKHGESPAKTTPHLSALQVAWPQRAPQPTLRLTSEAMLKSRDQ